jgi:hypothetical protein
MPARRACVSAAATGESRAAVDSPFSDMLWEGAPNENLGGKVWGLRLDWLLSPKHWAGGMSPQLSGVPRQSALSSNVGNSNYNQ